LTKQRNRLTTIAVSEENYLALKRLGSAGDSFNDVVTEVLKKVKQPLQTDSRVGRSGDQNAMDDVKTTPGSEFT
jgi:predicted CopG family antitoxin